MGKYRIYLGKMGEELGGSWAVWLDREMRLIFWIGNRNLMPIIEIAKRYKIVYLGREYPPYSPYYLRVEKFKPFLRRLIDTKGLIIQNTAGAPLSLEEFDKKIDKWIRKQVLEVL